MEQPLTIYSGFHSARTSNPSSSAEGHSAGMSLSPPRSDTACAEMELIKSRPWKVRKLHKLIPNPSHSAPLILRPSWMSLCHTLPEDGELISESQRSPKPALNTHTGEEHS